ncbi:UNVERIFIED_CONTAM: hypothetical protein RMT77_015235 [Armadillidium vulgare]
MSDTDKKNSDLCDSKSSDNCQDYFLDLEGKRREDSCPICCEKLNGKIGSPGNCNHFFCLDCISQWAKRIRTCPLDRKGFSSIQLFEKREGKMHRSDEDSIDLPENNSSSSGIGFGSLNILPSHLDPINIDSSTGIHNNFNNPDYSPSRNLRERMQLIDQTHNLEDEDHSFFVRSPLSSLGLILYRELMQSQSQSNHSAENH